MNKETANNGKKSINGVGKTFGTSLGSGVIGGVAAGLITPVQAFPQESGIEELEDVPVVEEEVTEDVVVEAAPEVEAEAAAVEVTTPNIDVQITINVNGAAEEEPVVEEPVEVEPVDDGLMAVATSVDDSMSFGQAFAAARTEVGPGGLFMWHGNTYGTYYKEEWDAMSAEDKEQYWTDVHHTTAHLNDDLGYNSDDDSEALLDDGLANIPEDNDDWNESLDENPDVDVLASNDIDPDIPIDNNMDMSAFA